MIRDRLKEFLTSLFDWRIVISAIVALPLGWICYIGHWAGFSPLIVVTLFLSFLLPFVAICYFLVCLAAWMKHKAKTSVWSKAFIVFAISVLAGQIAIGVIDSQMNNRAALLVVEAAELYEQRNGSRATKTDELVPEYLPELPQAWLGLVPWGRMQLSSDGTCAIRNADWYICYHCRKASGSDLEIDCID